jgi:hypothetical protein
MRCYVVYSQRVEFTTLRATYVGLSPHPLPRGVPARGEKHTARLPGGDSSHEKILKISKLEIIAGIVNRLSMIEPNNCQ